MHRLKQNLQHSSSICYHNKMFLISGSILHLGSLCATMHACSKVPSLSSYIGNLCPHCCTSTSRKNATRVHLALVFQSIRSAPSKFISFWGDHLCVIQKSNIHIRHQKCQTKYFWLLLLLTLSKFKLTLKRLKSGTKSIELNLAFRIVQV